MCVAFVFYRVSTFSSKPSYAIECCDAARENGVYGLVRRAKWSQWFSIGAAITRMYSVAKKFASYGAHVAWEDLESERKAGESRESRSREGKNGSAPGFNQWFRRQPGVSVKKNALAAHVTTEIRIVIRSTIVPLSNASPSLSLLLVCGLSAASYLLSVVSAAHARRFIVHPFSAFYFFLSNDVIAAPLFRKSSWRQMWHSSLTRQRSGSTTNEKMLRV